MSVWKQRLAAYLYHFQHPAWGLAHTRRVLEMAMELAVKEQLSVDEDVLVAAAYLHDIGSFKPFHRTGIGHDQRSVEVAAHLLEMVDFPMDKLERVQAVMQGHMFYAEPAAGNEAQVFHDADTLDFMGTVGIARLLAIVGLDDLTPDLASAIHLIDRYMHELPERLHTATAKEIGERRQQEMREFLERLAAQTENLRLL